MHSLRVRSLKAVNWHAQSVEMFGGGFRESSAEGTQTRLYIEVHRGSPHKIIGFIGVVAEWSKAID